MTNQFLSAGVESYTLRFCILCFVKYVHFLKYLQVFSCLVTLQDISVATLFLYESLFFTQLKERIFLNLTFKMV